MNNGPFNRTPHVNDSPESLVVAKVIREAAAFRNQGEDGHHVCRDFGIYIPEPGQIEAAEIPSIPPTQQELSGHLTLTCARLRNLYQSL